MYVSFWKVKVLGIKVKLNIALTTGALISKKLRRLNINGR